MSSVVNFTRVFFTFKEDKAETLCSSFLRMHDDADADSPPKHFVIQKIIFRKIKRNSFTEKRSTVQFRMVTTNIVIMVFGVNSRITSRS